MIFMKTKRAEVIKECTLKESAAINQILGKMVSEQILCTTRIRVLCSRSLSMQSVYVQSTCTVLSGLSSDSLLL